MQALIHAHQWNEALNDSDINRFNLLASKLNLESRYLSRIHKLIFLAPDIQLSILAGTQPPDLTLDRLSKHLDMPLCFVEQRRLYGFTPDMLDVVI
ncbi:MAG: hypothetical protein KUG75_01205 [Pseudomonadales bacterium]|nr:hypothetical protein [Pseudomonadales bacterium]